VSGSSNGNLREAPELAPISTDQGIINAAFISPSRLQPLHFSPVVQAQPANPNSNTPAVLAQQDHSAGGAAGNGLTGPIG
jgi:hypothetical protein